MSSFTLPLYTVTIFLSAFLLFAVQPMFTKMVLPRAGGSPAVWNTSVVFFQAVLLAGYLYAHLSTRLLGLKRQTILHAFVLVSAFLVLPIGIGATGGLLQWTGSEAPPPVDSPIPWLLGVLTVSVGLPFFAVSATSPLIQKWFANTDHAWSGDPYFLYGASNLGSMLALLSYPVVVEPLLGVRAQSITWMIGYAFLVAALFTCAVLLWKRFRPEQASSAESLDNYVTKEVTWGVRGRWTLLALVPSALLLGSTLHIGSYIAAVPFLAVAPILPDRYFLLVLSIGGFLLQSTLPVNVTFGQTLAPISAATVSSLMMGFAWGTGGLMVSLVGLLADRAGIEQALMLVAFAPLAGAVLALPLPDDRALRLRAAAATTTTTEV